MGKQLRGSETKMTQHVRRMPPFDQLGKADTVISGGKTHVLQERLSALWHRPPVEKLEKFLVHPWAEKLLRPGVLADVFQCAANRLPFLPPSIPKQPATFD